MQDYKEIRQRYLSGESKRHIAKIMGISRNTVDKYCEGGALPWERKVPERKSTVITNDVTEFILSCLKEDAEVSFKKQRHTARRIYERLVAECGFTGGESTIRRKVRELKASLPVAYIPLQFDPGEAIQVDWGEADVYENGEKVRINLFCARLCYSCKPIVLAYHQQNTESFCEAIVRTFDILGGVTQRVIFDNGRVAVKEGYGSHAKMQDKYAALSAHYGFDAVFCNPAQGHEKGLVEGLVGWARRNICVPVPKVKSINELNSLLLRRCTEYENHTVRGRKASVGILFTEESKYLRPLPKYTFETANCITTRVNNYSEVRYKSNTYSVPVQYAGFPVSVKGYPEHIDIYNQGTLIATHKRIIGRNKSSYRLEDYLPLIRQRPRAIYDAAPVKQNVPYEVLQKLKSSQLPDEKVIDILSYYSQNSYTDDNKEIKDVVIVQSVDLHKYDDLCIGKEVNTL